MSGVDWTSLPLSPLEGFVLSRIDGTASISILGDLTNLDPNEVGAMVEKLIELGVAEWARESVSLPRPTGRGPSKSTPGIEIPKNLRQGPVSASGPGGPRARLRLIRRAKSERPEGTYASKPEAEEHVDPARRSVRPSAAPRASHTGSIFPPGELEEVTVTVAPPVSDVSAEEPPAEGRRLMVPKSADAVGSEPPPEPEPEEESDDLDLDLERRKRINDLYYALDLLDHYQVLGVRRDATRTEVRQAYFSLSKVFHPDTMFRKRLGEYKSRMERIFQRLTEAYEVLGKKKARVEYDRYLGVQDRTRDVERAMESDPQEADEIERLGRAAARREADLAAAREASAVDRPVPEPEPPGAAESDKSVRTQMSPEGRARKRELMAKKLRLAALASSGSRRRNEPHGAAPSAPAEGPKPDRQQVLRSLASSLQQSATQTGGMDTVKRHELLAKRAEADGDLASAASYLRTALMGEPDREDLKAEHARVSAALSSSLAVSYEEQATYEQRHGKWGAAAISWAKVFEGRPDDADSARKAAVALVEAKGDLHQAKTLAQRAAELEPESVQNLRTLAQVYIAAGLGLNARRVLERAAKLDPGDEIVENLLRDLGS